MDPEGDPGVMSSSAKQERVESPAPSCLSMKSDKSMDQPIHFKGVYPSMRTEQERVESPAPSCLSMKSDKSMDLPIVFKGGVYPSMRIKQERVESPARSCLSMKSDKSMDLPIYFNREVWSPDLSEFSASLLTEDHYRCSVCSEVLRDPVSIPCGHSYCRQCISTYWAQPGPAGDYVCPQCSRSFRARPELSTNAALARMLQALQQAGFSPALPALGYAGPGDVACDICSGQKLRAVKTCLTCTASYCESHIRQHYTVPALQKHALAQVTGDGGHKSYHGNTVKTESVKEEKSTESETEEERERVKEEKSMEIDNEEEKKRKREEDDLLDRLCKTEDDFSQMHSSWADLMNIFKINTNLEQLNSKLKRVRNENCELSKVIAELKTRISEMEHTNSEQKNICRNLEQVNCKLTRENCELSQDKADQIKTISKLKFDLQQLTETDNKSRFQMINLNKTTETEMGQKKQLRKIRKVIQLNSWENDKLKHDLCQLIEEHDDLLSFLEKAHYGYGPANESETISTMPSDPQLKREREAETVRAHLEVMKGADWVEVPALGRPIHPGMLYDCRSESLKPDSLWDSDSVINGKTSLPFTSTETQLIERDSLHDRFRVLGLDQPIRNNFLSGLVKVGGAAKYLNHPLPFEEEVLSLQYKRTTRLDQLTPCLLQKVTRPEVIQQQTATHVVMAVTYGTQAFLLFERDWIRDSYHVLNTVKEMMSLCTDQDGATKLTDYRGFYEPNLVCKYYRDHGAQREVKGYRQIVDLCKSLPKLLGPSGEKAVPLTVWLCPLKNLHPAAACVREISVGLQDRVEREMVCCRQAERRCEMIVEFQAVSGSEMVIGDTKELKQRAEQVRAELQQHIVQLRKSLVSVRSGREEEGTVIETLDGLHSVVTSVHNLYRDMNKIITVDDNLTLNWLL